MTTKETNDRAWELACDCLDILPPEELMTAGVALVHMMAIWLRANDEATRPFVYMAWLEMLHHQLAENEILQIKTELSGIEEQVAAAVH